MNEIIRPTGFDLTKNLHGHVRVETRSRWTGKVIDSQEKDNLVTNAMQKLVYASSWKQASGLGSWFTPIYAKALGSLVLFGDTLTENADNIFFPNKKPLAIAPYAANADADGGSLNTSESGPISNGYIDVWDFTTSQANGTIAALARSNYQLRTSGQGYLGDTLYPSYGYAGGTCFSGTFLGYDETNKYVYFAMNYATTIGGVSVNTSSIYRVKKDLYKIDLENALVIPSRVVLVKTLASSDGTTTAVNWKYDRWADEFIYITGTTLHKLATDGTHTSSTISGPSSSSNFAVTENYYWRVYSNKAYRISKTNLADVTEYSLPSTCYMIWPVGNDLVACAYSSTRPMYVLYADGTVETRDGGASASFNQGGPTEVGLFYSGTTQYQGQLYMRNNYLGTIANLDSPVTKTSSQTMKITYTLTEA